MRAEKRRIALSEEEVLVGVQDAREEEGEVKGLKL